MALEAEKILPSASGIQFGKTVSHQSGSKPDLAVSPDGLALTATFNDMEAQIRNSGPDAPLATKLSSFVLPLTGQAKGVDLRFRFQGQVVTSGSGSGHILYAVNEKTALFDFGPNQEESFTHHLNYQAGRASECRINIYLFVENDSQAKDFGASVTLSAIDATVGDPIP
jgi:hypothetical protein